MPEPPKGDNNSLAETPSASSHDTTRQSTSKMRSVSIMSVEEPMTPASRCSDDTQSDRISIVRLSQDIARTELTRHISHASYTAAIGCGIAPNIDPLTLTQTKRSTALGDDGADPAFEVDFAPGDTGNPHEWTMWYKGVILLIMSYSTTCVVLYSTSYTSAIPGIAKEFGISPHEGILGVTTYLLGVATGSIITAPLSEMFGRRPVYLVTLAFFIVFVIPCALAHNLATILALRFLGACCAAAMISNAPGSVNDIVDDEYRAFALSVWSIGPILGPVLGPVVGGFVYQYLGWRWTNWVVVIVTSVGWLLVALVPETYAPTLLRKRAAEIRKAKDDTRWWSRYDDKSSFWSMLKMNLSRPFTMTVTEPILIFWDLYIALVYGILYLCFVAYPLVFADMRGWSPGFTGLAFSGIGVGSILVVILEPLIRKMINAHRHDPETGAPYPEAMVSVICIASILIPAGQLWYSWTCTPNVHWIVPIIAGVPFGMGNAGVFIYSGNYLVKAYGIYAASALSGGAVTRSIVGAFLPLAGPPLFKALGANWTGTLLGLLEALCIPIPFIFYRYGGRIRAKSTLIRQMQEDQARLDARHLRAQQAECKAQAKCTDSAEDSSSQIEKQVEYTKVEVV